MKFPTGKSDLILIVDGTKIPVHRLVISAESEFFDLLAYGQDFMEANQKEIPIVDVDLHSFHLILQYMYCKTVDLTAVKSIDDVLNFLELARRFGLETLQNGIVEYLKRIISTENIFTILHASKHLDLKNLQMAAITFIWTNIRIISECQEFLDLKPDLILDLLKRKGWGLRHFGIRRIFKKWINHNRTSTEAIKDAIMTEIGYETRRMH